MKKKVLAVILALIGVASIVFVFYMDAQKKAENSEIPAENGKENEDVKVFAPENLLSPDEAREMGYMDGNGQVTIEESEDARKLAPTPTPDLSAGIVDSAYGEEAEPTRKPGKAKKPKDTPLFKDSNVYEDPGDDPDYHPDIEDIDESDQP